MSLPAKSSTAYDSAHYQRLLNQITWNIRRTLDLETIWQQTVEGFGQALQVSRCLVFDYQDDRHQRVLPQAEYCTDLVESCLEYYDCPELRQLVQEALLSLKPVCQPISIPAADATAQPSAIELAGSANPANAAVNSSQRSTVSCLAIATCYQDQPNGLVILQQCNAVREWTELEIQFAQDLADQVGTAIAHASLFDESQTLARELQRVNEDLLEKHRELAEAKHQAEEARKQAEEASRLKSEFLANTSHELRTPLNGMIGFLKLVLDGMADDPEEQNEFVHEAYQSAVHLLQIINDILDIAKIEAGKMQIEMNPVKLIDLLNAVENFTRTQAEQKNLKFEILMPATRDEVLLYGNYQRLLQVLLNLVGNAIKFTHEGSVTISAEVLPKPPDVPSDAWSGFAKLSVADTGIGVSLDKQDKLFQSFSQVDGSRTRQYGGTGLGLTISQKLVEAMGGEVNFYSMGEGLGSTVTFTVPLYQEPVMISSEGDSLVDLQS
ncbi:MAG: ATP-binding protein [Thainema sp.]